MYPAPKFWEF